MRFAWIILFLIAQKVLCQPYFDLFELENQKSEKLNFTHSDSGKLELNIVRSRLLVPVQRSNHDILIIGANYQCKRLRGIDNDFGKDQIFDLGLNIGYIKALGSDWSVFSMLFPRISSDLEDLSGEDFQLAGSMLFTKQVHQNLKYKIGYYISGEYFGLLFVPIVGIDWRVNDRLNIFGLVPAGMNLEYKLNKSLYAGISYESITRSFRLNSNMYSDYVRNGDRFWGQYLIYSFINFYLHPNIVLYVEPGLSVSRRYERYKIHTKDRVHEHGLYQKTNDGFYINVGIAIRKRFER